jgi:hypothetical protein
VQGPPAATYDADQVRTAFLDGVQGIVATGRYSPGSGKTRPDEKVHCCSVSQWQSIWQLVLTAVIGSFWQLSCIAVVLQVHLLQTLCSCYGVSVAWIVLSVVQCGQSCLSDSSMYLALLCCCCCPQGGCHAAALC